MAYILIYRGERYQSLGLYTLYQKYLVKLYLIIVQGEEHVKIFKTENSTLRRLL